MSTRFALGTFAANGRTIPALVLEDRVFDLGERLDRQPTIRDLLEHWDSSLELLQTTADTLRSKPGDFVLGDLRPLPPVIPCGQIFQAAANYRQHVLELLAGAESRADGSDGLTAKEREQARIALDERARTGAPFVFTGSAHAMVGAEDEIELPYDSTQPDWEIELAAVIGRGGRRLPRERALEIVAGYTICNDLTRRDALLRSDARTLGIDWLAAKNSPTFLPTGPLMVPAVHVADPMNLRMRLDVNGRTMQDHTTADMLFDIASLISHISTVAELRPGDLVLTGSPAGNGASYGIFLKPGDEIEAAIEGLGIQRNRCRAETRPQSQEVVEEAVNGH